MFKEITNQENFQIYIKTKKQLHILLKSKNLQTKNKEKKAFFQSTINNFCCKATD